VKKFLFPLLMLVSCASAPVQSAKQTPFSVLDKSTFLVQFEKDGVKVGTAFCVPGTTSVLMTASHVIQTGYWITDYQGKRVQVKSVLHPGTDHKDIATILLEDPICDLNQNEWASKNEEPSSRQMILFGYGSGEKILTTGNIAGPVGALDRFVIDGQLANLNALGGHSGGPVYNPEGKIVGMLVGSISGIDVIDVIIPVETLKKVLK
jgi:hypothetical protein